MKKLMGSEKQIAWAEEIRNDYLKAVEEYRSLAAKESLTSAEKNRISSLKSVLVKNYQDAEDSIEAKYLCSKEKKAEKRAIEEKYSLPERYSIKKLDEEPRKLIRAIYAKYKELEKKEIDALVESAIEEKLKDDSAKNWIENRLR